TAAAFAGVVPAMARKRAIAGERIAHSRAQSIGSLNRIPCESRDPLSRSTRGFHARGVLAAGLASKNDGGWSGNEVRQMIRRPGPDRLHSAERGPVRRQPNAMQSDVPAAADCDRFRI